MARPDSSGSFTGLPSRPRRRPPRPGANQQALSLWLMFGSICAAVVIYVAVKANYDRAAQPIEGSTETQQKRADELRQALEQDSNRVDVRIALADILYDTGNWSEAIVHYRSGLRRDSTRVNAMIDLGVCYYNLGHTAEAERYFLSGLKLDPHQPVALFNLGIVNERRNDYLAALKYFHRALQSEPPEEMRQPIMEAMQRIQQKTGKVAPSLPPPGG